jgi:hypothetical protein
MKRSPLRRKLPPKREATQSTYTPRCFKFAPAVAALMSGA